MIFKKHLMETYYKHGPDAVKDELARIIGGTITNVKANFAFMILMNEKAAKEIIDLLNTDVSIEDYLEELINSFKIHDDVIDGTSAYWSKFIFKGKAYFAISLLKSCYNKKGDLRIFDFKNNHVSVDSDIPRYTVINIPFDKQEFREFIKYFIFSLERKNNK